MVHLPCDFEYHGCIICQAICRTQRSSIMKRTLTPLLSVVLLALLATNVAAVDDWPFWRGPNRNDQSEESGLLKSWPEDGPKQLWVNEAGGLGYAGFAVVGDQLFTMGLDGDEEFALCLNADTGKEIWKTTIGPRFRNGWGDGPRSTPSVDGDWVYFMSAAGSLACVKASDGTKKWSVSMSDFGGVVPKWGYAESPLVDGDQVICTPGGSKTTIVAIDKLTGKTVWRSKPVTSELSDGKRSKPATAHYSSVLPVTHNGQRQYIQLLSLAIVGMDAKSGDLLWQSPFPGRIAVIPSPIYTNGDVYVTAGYGVGSKKISIAENNQVSEQWSSKAMQNHHGQVIKIGDYVYGSSAKAFVCQSLEDGSMKWADRSVKKGAISYVDGMFIAVEERSGRVLLLEATPDSKPSVKGKFTLSPQSKKRSPRGMIWVHPVVSNGKLYLRDQEYIHCYDLKK